MIRITVKGLAKFMTSGFAGQRKILHDFKFPDPEGGVQAAYYADARRAIKEYHDSENDAAVIAYAVDDLKGKAHRETERKRTRLEHNIRALESYLDNFGDKNFKVLAMPELKYSRGAVVVSAIPDLCVQQDGRKKLIKLDFGSKEPDTKLVNIIIQVIYQAASSEGLPVTPKDVIYLDVPRGRVHKGARVRTRLNKEIQAACDNIEALWPGIKR